MKELICSARGCTYRIKYYNIEEESYYCEGCAYSFFNESEFERIGSPDTIKQIIELCKNLLDKVENYANYEKLTIKWKMMLDFHNSLYDEHNKIKKELEEIQKDKKLWKLPQLLRRSTKLKSNIWRKTL